MRRGASLEISRGIRALAITRTPAALVYSWIFEACSSSRSSGQPGLRDALSPVRKLSEETTATGRRRSGSIPTSPSPGVSSIAAAISIVASLKIATRWRILPSLPTGMRGSRIVAPDFAGRKSPRLWIAEYVIGIEGRVGVEMRVRSALSRPGRGLRRRPSAVRRARARRSNTDFSTTAGQAPLQRSGASRVLRLRSRKLAEVAWLRTTGRELRSRERATAPCRELTVESFAQVVVRALDGDPAHHHRGREGRDEDEQDDLGSQAVERLSTARPW